MCYCSEHVPKVYNVRCKAKCKYINADIQVPLNFVQNQGAKQIPTTDETELYCKWASVPNFGTFFHLLFLQYSRITLNYEAMGILANLRN